MYATNLPVNSSYPFSMLKSTVSNITGLSLMLVFSSKRVEKATGTLPEKTINLTLKGNLVVKGDEVVGR